LQHPSNSPTVCSSINWDATDIAKPWIPTLPTAVAIVVDFLAACVAIRADAVDAPVAVDVDDTAVDALRRDELRPTTTTTTTTYDDDYDVTNEAADGYDDYDVTSYAALSTHSSSYSSCIMLAVVVLRPTRRHAVALL
jgi:hypothetical protein